jgi:hypothetical protein
MAKSKRASIHYVNNAEFSQAVVTYVKSSNQAKEEEKPIPIVPNYIADCFLRIAEGLSHKSNFIRYTYREEMVMDAVENCLKAINNYNIEAATRTGNPNAFAYFTQISWYAFLRRIAKEKKHQDIKERFMTEAGVEAFIAATGSVETTQMVQHFVDELRDRIDKVKAVDTKVSDFAKKDKQVKRKRVMIVDSDLTDFMDDE